MLGYDQHTEQMMLRYYGSLQERERRHYAAQEVHKLGYGGKSYISGLLKISPKTIRKGEAELQQADLYALVAKGKQRRSGGGRKKFCSAG
jgi:DeoR/GlpR family transcriptional regulator of sugar metabolism